MTQQIKSLVLVSVFLFGAGFYLSAQISSNTEELHSELSKGNTEKVMEIITRDISVIESPNPRGSTPLTIATSDGYKELVIFLVQKGANVNSSNNYGNTPLHYAAWKSDFESFKYLYDNGAKLEAKNNMGQTPLQYACMGGNEDIFRFCISKGMDIKARCDDGSSLIHWAANGGNLDIFKYLETEGFDIRVEDKDGISPIFYAAAKNRTIVVKYLVEEKGINVNTISGNGSCLLRTPVEYGNYDVLKYLLEKGADINIKLEDNKTWLGLASESGSCEMIKLLIDSGCDVNAFDDYANTPLLVAAASGRFDIVKLLVDNGARTEPGYCKRESCTNSGNTPLHAASRRSPSIAQYLIANGADVNKADLEGNTALHAATMSDSTKIIEILCKNGSNVNQRNNWGETPVVKAVKRNKPEMIIALTDYSADLNITDNSGKTALHHAAINGYDDVFDILTVKDASIDVRDNNGRTPAYYAIYYGNNNIAEKLFQAGSSKENMPLKSTKLLENELETGEAVVWYLNHSAWAVKTSNHLLIFDYWFRDKDPEKPCLNNGRINSEEITNQNIIVFASHNHQDHFSRAIFDWSKNVKNINYVLGFESSAYGNYIYIAPHDERTVDNVRITPISSTDSGEGFMVEADGVKIYHPGDHANRYVEEDKDFSSEIDFLNTKYNDIDIAFVPISGCNFSNKDALKKGNDYLVDKFNPRLVLPMHGGGNENKYREYADEKNTMYNTSVYQYVSARGDRIFYSRENGKGSNLESVN